MAEETEKSAVLFHLAPRRGWGWFYVIYGLLTMGLGVFFPFVAKSLWAGLTFISAPCILLGFLATLTGWSTLRSRLTLTNEGLDLTVPSWRGFPCPPGRTWRLAWSQLRAITQVRVQYRTFVMIGPVPAFPSLPVMLHVIDTDQGRIVLSGGILKHLPHAVALMAKEAGLEIQQGEQRRGSLLKALFTGKLPLD
ncbi:MAG: hypothetical protein KQJ78_16740 [Deltaproteobacteria bacterium]|nr:hypothetical protein [Deltaproteobacteria bacterium]